MIPLAFVIGLASATLVVLVVVVVTLAKQAMRLGRSLEAFQRDMRPVLEEIQQGADRATTRLERLRAPDERGRSSDHAERRPAR